MILARESPVGADLRRVVAILRLVRDVERAAVNVGHVCRTVRHHDPRALPEALRALVDELGRRAVDVYRQGVTAWRRRDALAVSEVDRRDELVDRLLRRLHAELSRHEGAPDDPLAAGLVARYYERVADHGVAIARDTAYLVTGERVGSPT